MKTKIALLLFLFLVSSPAAGQETNPVNPLTEEAVIVPLKKDQSAPFDGVLVSPEAVAKMISEKEVSALQAEAQQKQAVDFCKAEAQKTIDDNKASSNADKGILTVERDKARKDAAQLQLALKKEVEGRPNMLFWMGVSGAAGIAATVLVVILTK